MNQALSALVRRRDPDRFLTALFAPPEKRDALFALYAFNHELARAREVASQPALALIRLQWWREVVEGAPRRHEVAEPLSAAIGAGALSRDDLSAMIDAREAGVESEFATMEKWRDYVMGSAGGVAVAAARLLGATDPECMRPFGAAYGIAGLLRGATIHARQGRHMLPANARIEDLAREGLALLRPTSLPRNVIAAALPAVLARRDLRRSPHFPMQRGLADRLAVMFAGFSGRV
jgi:phytoene synthase